MILAKDISRWQGTYSDTPEPIVFVKISGGDQGLYIDPQAANNYNQVIAHGHAFGGYHFAGGGDPIAEANFFLNAMKPWNPGEVPALDWEIQHPDPVGWCTAFANQVHFQTGAWPLIYMNLATLRAFNWAPLLAICGLWLADWTGSPDELIDTGAYTYTMQQYNDGPNYDHDVYFGTVEQFKKIGWPAAPAPPPPPAPAPAPEPAPPVPPAPTPPPAPVPTPTPEPAPTPPSTLPGLSNNVPTPPEPIQPYVPPPVYEAHYNIFVRFIVWLKMLFTKKK